MTQVAEQQDVVGFVRFDGKRMFHYGSVFAVEAHGYMQVKAEAACGAKGTCAEWKRDLDDDVYESSTHYCRTCMAAENS